MLSTGAAIAAVQADLAPASASSDQEPGATVHPHDTVPDVLCVHGSGPYHLDPAPAQVVVGELCGMAVMRGADVFAPGVLAMGSAVKQGDKVSVWADLSGQCLRGQTTRYDGRKLFVGNGVAAGPRGELFGPDASPRGVFVRMVQPVYRAPSLDRLRPGLAATNLPSCIAVHELGPVPGERVLDMCAAPGGKTAHIAALMADTGTLVRPPIRPLARFGMLWRCTALH